ncbi:MAG: pre-peptidase C-terminal domain-containing protein [Planctomycetota bacterium]|nr:pre-peptidase C-terminal domain-containing protein [Planctomycetota bacterium]
MSRRFLLVQMHVTAIVCLTLTAFASAASPRLGSITPRGVQRGQEIVVSFNGSNLGDAEQIFFYEGKGFEVTKLEPSGGNVKVTMKIAPDVRLGEHVAQVRTKTGLSDYRTFWVEDLAVVEEKEPNSEFAAPQAVELNKVINGNVGNEDVDYYVVEAKKGQRISAEVVAMRLSTALFDPYVAILNSERFELSANDDTPLALQDAYAAIVAPEDGKYIIEVRESAYANGNNYRLHVGTFPRPTAAYPAGGKMGEEVEVKFLGLPSGELAQKFALPAEAVTDFGVFAKDEGGIAPTPNNFRLFEHGNAFEAEPNNEMAKATPVELPLAFNGIIQEPKDIDFFRFSAKKGQQFEVECFARRIRSGLDPVMNLYKADGGGIAGNDDSRGPDSYFRFNVPADGEYIIRVTDHLGRGGPDLVYRIEFQQIKPSLSLSIPRVERYGQYRQQIYVPRGGRFATLINAGRGNFGGELVLEGKDLPAGLKMLCDNMPSNMNTMPVVFEAAADAPLSGKLLNFTARHVENEGIRGGFGNTADYIIGAPGQSRYRWKSVKQLAVAVVEELPFKIDIVVPKVPVVRDGSMQLKIVATKKEGWDEGINVQLPFRPPGLGAASSVNIAKGNTEVNYPINANGGAQIKKWKVFALGTSGGMWSSSQLADLEIADAFVRFEMQRPACEQGQEAQILCKLNHTTPFEGEATAQLLGVPPKVTATPMKFTKDTKELVFNLKTDPASPVGKHNMICQVTITKNGEPIVSRAGGVQLQIDKPLPPPPDAPKPMPKPKAEEKKPEAKPKPKPKKPPKPLTRLQKLRLAAKKRQEEKAKAAQEGGE